MSKDAPRLSRLGVLAPAALSACMDASVLAVPAASAIVSTVLKELSKAFMLKKWFHGVMSAKEAESLIMEKGKNGSFLVRESQTHPGEYVLSVRVRGRVSHVMIRKQQDKYDVGSGEQFDDLVGLIEHFRSYPIIESSGDVLRLLQPVSGTCLRAQDTDREVQEMDILGNLEYRMVDHDSEYRTALMIDKLNTLTYVEAAKCENSKKNRYRNIIPYDQTRIVLRKPLGRPDASDYINATFIRSYLPHKNGIIYRPVFLPNPNNPDVPLIATYKNAHVCREGQGYIKLDPNKCTNLIRDKYYIATQGCLPNTIDDFWRMIWQEDVRVIAMITKEIEKGKRKCERYWPAIGQEVRYGGILIRSFSESFFEDYRVREMEVSLRNKSKRIYQYQFTNWPDHGIPREAEAILNFVDDVNRKMYNISQEKNAPARSVLCVHCSAGVGRTGTFIAIDMIVNRSKEHGFSNELYVFDAVKTLRLQRAAMVQNLAQYRYIHFVLKAFNQLNISTERKAQFMEGGGLALDERPRA
ncbi:unnamed protein product [Colias eurytheme]|nr:unnamed protein product [Colias eurytheme]